MGDLFLYYTHDEIYPTRTIGSIISDSQIVAVNQSRRLPHSPEIQSYAGGVARSWSSTRSLSTIVHHAFLKSHAASQDHAEENNEKEHEADDQLVTESTIPHIFL